MAAKMKMSSRKVTVPALAGAVVTVLATLSKDALGYEMGSELTGALVTLIMAGLVYVIPEKEL
jgi:hypothetical protein